MSDATHPERWIGRVRGAHPGPTVIVSTSIHGNEIDGVIATRRLLARLDPERVHGTIAAWIGNLGARTAGRRYLERDLNRLWTEAEVAATRTATEEARPDHREMRELLSILEEEFPRDGSRGILIDLHSTSSAGPPFAVFGDTRPNRELAFALGIPAILGLEEAIDGTLLEFLARRGHVAVCVEGGPIGHPETAELLEAALLVLLVRAGVVTPSARGELAAARRKLADAARGLPHVLEIRYRHALARGQDFHMREGWSGFDEVRAGTPLADQGGAEVRAPEDGYLLMPLYQPQGDDGFFLARPVRRFWLRLSAVLRMLRADRLARRLPGVRPDPDEAEGVLVDPRVARWWTVEIFHLLGFRRERPQGQELSFSRRRPAHLPALPVAESTRSP